LLAAESEEVLRLPPEFVAHAAAHVEGCVHRARDYPINTGEFGQRVLYRGEIRDENEAVGFLSHPWAMEACIGLLERHERIPLPSDDQTRIQRTLDHLVQLAASQESAEETRLFAMAELLFGLGAVRK
jgi:hypothetical protein